MSIIPPNRSDTAPKPLNGPWFTLDDIPKAKWPSRLQEFTAWIDVQMLRPGSSVQSVLREFNSRFLGSLRDWFDSLSQYRQLRGHITRLWTIHRRSNPSKWIGTKRIFSNEVLFTSTKRFGLSLQVHVNPVL